MKKIVFFILLNLIFSLTRALSLEVDIDEIRSSQKIEFLNYKGKYKFTESTISIRSIGFQLAEVEIIDEAFRYHMKYSIIHAVDDRTSDQLNADIFSIDRDANVDNISNVRLIISGYLERKYSYSRKNSETLATFLTYYNAINRGNLGYLNLRYKPIVTKHINEKDAGISTKYYEWPGRTKLLIPLTNSIQSNKFDNLNTEEISNEKVIEKLKKEDDKGIEERKDMTKIKEKELKEEKKIVDKEKRELEKEKKTIEEKKNKINEEKKDIERKEEELTKKKEETKEITNKKEKEKKQKEIKEEEKRLKEKKDIVRKKEDELKRQEDVTKKKEEIVTKKDNKVKEKTKKLEKEKQDIKKDEVTLKKEKAKENEKKKDTTELKKELDKKEKELSDKEKELKEKEDDLRTKQMDKNIYGDNFYYLKNIEYMVNGHYNNEMYIIDAKSRQIKIKSPLREICGNKFDIFKEGAVVISYINTHDSSHYLALLDLDSLELKNRGKDNIFFRSFVEVRDGFIYAILKENEDYYLGKFNSNLELVKKSEIKIDNSTFITFYKEFIYLNNEKLEIAVLNKEDLKMVDTIKP